MVQNTSQISLDLKQAQWVEGELPTPFPGGSSAVFLIFFFPQSRAVQGIALETDVPVLYGVELLTFPRLDFTGLYSVSIG